MISGDLAFYVALGFAAQLVDGALGMAYGLIATSVLLASGAPPALSSASVHAAEVVTTGLAGASHVWHQNVDWRTFRRLAVAGVIGGVTGAYVLTELPEKPVKVFVTLYLFGMALLILHRIIMGLIIGGALAAPFAGWFSRVLPQQVLMSLVALTVSGLGVYNFVQLGGA
jgi:uncharacterized membrane protein YfcA